MANVALFLLGASLLITARQPILLSTIGQKLGSWFKGGNVFEATQPVVFYQHAGMALAGPPASAPRPAPRIGRRGLALGLSWAFIPCGPLYTAWTLVLFAGDPFSGAMTAAAFAVASGAQLGLAPHQQRTRSAGQSLGSRWRTRGRRRIVSVGGVLWAMLIGSAGKGGLFCL